MQELAVDGWSGLRFATFPSEPGLAQAVVLRLRAPPRRTCDRVAGAVAATFCFFKGSAERLCGGPSARRRADRHRRRAHLGMGTPFSLVLVAPPGLLTV